jgi:hypothetical protein
VNLVGVVVVVGANTIGRGKTHALLLVGAIRANARLFTLEAHAGCAVPTILQDIGGIDNVRDRTSDECARGRLPGLWQ